MEYTVSPDRTMWVFSGSRITSVCPVTSVPSAGTSFCFCSRRADTPYCCAMEKRLSPFFTTWILIFVSSSRLRRSTHAVYANTPPNRRHADAPPCIQWRNICGKGEAV